MKKVFVEIPVTLSCRIPLEIEPGKTWEEVFKGMTTEDIKDYEVQMIEHGVIKDSFRYGDMARWNVFEASEDGDCSYEEYEPSILAEEGR